MIDISKISTALSLEKDGLWRSRHASKINYPQEGCSNCLAVEDNSFWFRHRNHCLIQVIREFPPAGPIFDVGGGNGYVSLSLNESGFETVLVEPGAVAVRNARLRGIEQIICSSFEEAGFRENMIPAVGLFDVLEHIEDDVSFLKKLERVLIPEGKVYITVPAFRLLWSNEDDYAMHFRRYTIKEIQSKCEKASLRVEYGCYFFSILVLPVFLLRSVPTRLGLCASPTQAKTKREHLIRKGILSSLIELLLRSELKLIKRGKKIPIGSSCLVVASPKRSA